MIHRVTLFMLTAFLSACGREKGVEIHDFPKYGISCALPSSWVLMSREKSNQLVEKGVSKLSQEMKDTVEASRSTSEILVSLFRDPPRSAKGVNASFNLIVEHLPVDAEVTVAESLKNAKGLISNSGLNTKFLDPPKSFTAGSVTFDGLRYQFEAKEKVAVVTIWLGKYGANIFTVQMAHGSDGDHETLSKIVQSITFDKS